MRTSNVMPAGGTEFTPAGWHEKVRNRTNRRSTAVGMLVDNRPMARLAFSLTALLGLVACTRENPTNCLDNFCNDPTLPYCDADGSISGVPGTCIAVACEPLAFEACSGDNAVTCDATGTSYDTTPCEFGCGLVGCRECAPNQTACADGASVTCDAQGFVAESTTCLLGCDGTTGECRRCEPNQTTCTNGNVVTCDAAGNVTDSVECPLGCFEDEPRCAAPRASNNLNDYLAMVLEPPDVDLSNADFQVSSGIVTAGAQTIEVPNFLIPATANSNAVRVFVVNKLTLRGAAARLGDGIDSRVAPGPAIAFVASDSISIEGTFVLSPQVGGATRGCESPGPGSFREESMNSSTSLAGGGGGNASAGGAGGPVTGDPLEPAEAGGVSGAEGLEPLRGGCSGGFSEASNGTYPTGGGAIQLTALRAVRIDGTIDVRGATGERERGGQASNDFLGGGGAGGGVLIEGPAVTLGSNARLLAQGGPGAARCVTASATCGTAGRGATSTTVATDGGSATAASGAGVNVSSGGGGGGLGRIRINTASGSFESSEVTELNGAVTSGLMLRN